MKKLNMISATVVTIIFPLSVAATTIDYDDSMDYDTFEDLGTSSQLINRNSSERAEMSVLRSTDKATPEIAFPYQDFYND
ncbi:MAG: hypothetical protein U9N50_14245 [Pseudomonadota bacterium]|nr:hypothetical protein [Pseudomonadota bacterium]